MQLKDVIRQKVTIKRNKITSIQTIQNQPRAREREGNWSLMPLIVLLRAAFPIRAVCTELCVLSNLAVDEMDRNNK